MDPSLASQQQKVKAWLHEIFGDEQVPEFEINQQTIEYLYQLSQETRQHDGHLQLVTKDLQQKAAEYNAEAQRLSGILHRIQLTPESLSQTGANSLATLSKLGVLLDVRDPSNTSYLLAMQDVDDDLEKVSEEAEAEADELKKLTKSYHKVLQQCNSLQKVLDVAKAKATEDSQLNSKREHETTFLLQKEKGYKKEMKKMEVQFSQTKIDRSLFHESLVKKSEALKDIHSQLEPLRAELASYSVLPPDLDEAKVKLFEYKRELERLDKQLLDCIGNMAL
ncbi:HAUS augmin-like complex subunit 1 [Plakobranchus ocellatus]|uniref:HAUS augmin-like complex subunit 1 n=1 Tax=Plakobranchus ocellatus TaxID=259542 RepID=A0AAV4CGR1_9GAST|nr:HAUS augmin-like complex subunit 1 [Plakobranchus ocellatus]